MLIYDIVTLFAIPPKNDNDRDPNIEYAAGWDDIDNLGIAVICALDTQTDMYHAFLQDNLPQFQELLDDADRLVGFNNHQFDDLLLKANGFTLREDPYWSYDVLQEIWLAAGVGKVKSREEFRFGKHTGYPLAAMAEVNFDLTKPMKSEDAAAAFQSRWIGQVIEDCLFDVHVTALMVDCADRGTPLVSPKGGDPLKLAGPFPKLTTDVTL